MALNVTTAVIGSGCNTATATPSLAQWDQGQVLKIEGVDLPSAYQVEFSTEYTRNAIPQIGNAAGVAIPNELLQRSAPITAYIVLHEGENDRETEYWITIHITPRTRPETVTPDPEEQSVIDETIAALQAGVAAAEAAAQSVQNMGVEAETLPEGSAAAVEKTVDPETGAVTLSFGIPTGPTGATGPAGPQGERGETGPAGPAGVIQSVNGKSAASITLDSGDIEFDDSATYAAGSIGAEVSDAKNAISGIENAVGSIRLVEWEYTSGYYIKTNVTTIDTASPYTSYGSYRGKCKFMSCSPGDVFIVSLLGGAKYRPYIFCNSVGEIIVWGDNVQYHDEQVIAPANAAYVGFNSDTIDAYGTVYKDTSMIRVIEDEIAEIADDISSIENEVGSIDLVSWEHEFDGYYINTQNTVIGTSTIDTSDPYTYSASYRTGKATFIACEPGDAFIISLYGKQNYRPYVICDSNGVIIEAGQWEYQYNNYRLVIPANAAYIGFNSDELDEYRTIYKDNSKINELDARVDALESASISPYQNLACVAFGTSLTYRDTGYRPYLAETLGMTIDNQGVGSSYWQWWQQNSSNILYNVQNYTDYADKDVCIIEGCVNDWGNARVLGTYDDTSTDTVCGCLYNMISYIYAQKPSIQIIVILDHFGRDYGGSGNCSSSAKNSNNQTQYDYYEEIAKTCEFYGIPCVKEYALSSIGIFGQQYLADQIHLNLLGAKQSAKVIGKAMINFAVKEVT